MFGIKKVADPSFFVPVMVVALIAYAVVARNVLGIGNLVTGASSA